MFWRRKKEPKTPQFMGLPLTDSAVIRLSYWVRQYTEENRNIIGRGYKRADNRNWYEPFLLLAEDNSEFPSGIAHYLHNEMKAVIHAEQNGETIQLVESLKPDTSFLPGYEEFSKLLDQKIEKYPFDRDVQAQLRQVGDNIYKGTYIQPGIRFLQGQAEPTTGIYVLEKLVSGTSPDSQ